MRLLQDNSIDPWREFGRVFGGLRHDSGWVPEFDIEETDAAYVLRGDVPGMSQKDIEIRIDEGMLSVKGERQTVTNGKAQPHYARRERRGGKFARQFWLPETVDTDSVKASYVNGVVQLTLPKREPVDTSRLIPVK